VSWGALQYAVLVVSENESVDQLCNAATAAARNVFFERLAKFRRTSPSMKQDTLANASLQSIVSWLLPYRPAARIRRAKEARFHFIVPVESVPI